MRHATLVLAILLPTQGVARAAVPVGPVPIDPNGWTISSKYPPESLRDKPQGVVAFRLQVARDGVPTECTVAEASGAADVDTKTCEWLVKRARFRPARDSGGKAVGGHYETRFGWTLKPGGLAPMPDPGSLAMTAIIEPDGRISECKVERAGMRPGGQFDTWCGDLQAFTATPDTSGKMVRRRLILKRSLSYEEIPES
jgi:protein TonB